MKTSNRWLRAGPKFFSSSIRNRIIIPYALLTLVLAAFGTFVVTQLVAGSVEERFRNQLLDSGRIVSDEIVHREELRLEVERAVANTIGVSQALIDRDFEQLDRLVSPLIANNKNIDSVLLVDTQGKEVLRLQRQFAVPGSPAQTDRGSGADFFNWWAVANVLSDPEGDLKEVQIAQDPNSNELIIYTIGPIRTAEGTVGAVLVGTYLKHEVELIRELALADVTLFNEQGQVVMTTLVLDRVEAAEVFQDFTPDLFQKIVKLGKDVTLLDDIEGVTEGTGQDVETRGKNYRLAYAPFMLRNRVYGVYSVALPTNFITDTNNTSRLWLSFIFTGGVIAVLVIGYLISQRITGPVVRLAHTAQDIAKGNLDQRTGLKQDDEIGILASTFDEMTAELQKKTAALREEASKLTAILNSIADGVIVQDLEGNIITTNPAAEEILAAIGGNLIHPQSQEEIGEASSEQSEGQSAQLLTRLTGLEFHESRRFEMERRVLSALSAPVVTLDGEQLGSVVVLRDITREVEAERLKDDFITSMSHELRTPPTAIKGYNDLLKMLTADKLTERELSFIDAIDQNVTDLLNIIQQMLDLSQIDAGTLGIDQERENLIDIIETEAGQWSAQMEEKELRLRVHLPNTPIWIEGDEERLGQVMHNILSNAYNYTRPGGTVEIWLKQDNGNVRVDVKDTGVGISEEDQRFLFTRFFRAIHEESTFEVSGAGLGLYMSRAIIEAHGGKMWLEESQLHQGSTFSFTLPVMAQTPAELAEDFVKVVES
ncbi:MAG: HAMP domain-containing protein [Anaerolineae bacterium]|nr:HAMP domain-containing protein [Anaerolineae bacterium]